MQLTPVIVCCVCVLYIRYVEQVEAIKWSGFARSRHCLLNWVSEWGLAWIESTLVSSLKLLAEIGQQLQRVGTEYTLLETVDGTDGQTHTHTRTEGASSVCSLKQLSMHAVAFTRHAACCRIYKLKQHPESQRNSTRLLQHFLFAADRSHQQNNKSLLEQKTKLNCGRTPDLIQSEVSTKGDLPKRKYFHVISF